VTRARDDGRSRPPRSSAGLLAAVDTLSEYVAEAPEPGPGWWRRREVSRHFEDRLREVGRRVVLGPAAAVLLDPSLRAETSELRRIWRDLHPQADHGALVSAQELAAAVEELRRRFDGVERLLRPGRGEPLAAASATRARPRQVGNRAARR
jgi:hypothetical protein